MTPEERPNADVLLWRKSTYSGSGNQCVEVAQSGLTLLIRDTTNRAAGCLDLSTPAWSALLSALKH